MASAGPLIISFGRKPRTGADWIRPAKSLFSCPLVSITALVLPAAIDLVARLAPDVVLLDVVLPDMDGFAVADRLAAAGNSSAVVLTSGHDRGDFAGRIQSAPVRGFLPKEMISGPALATLLAGDQL